MSARDLALNRIDAKRLPDWPHDLIRLAPRAMRDPRDLSLAEQIEAGVVKNLLHLRHLIVHHSGRSLRSIDPLVQKIIAVALYQIRFLQRIPPHAAVHEAVEQTRRFGCPRAAGMVNAVLRNALRQPDPPLPDAQTHPAEHAALALSHPPELFRHLAALVGPERAIDICRHNNRQPPTIVRLIGRIDDLNAEGVTVLPHEHAGMYVVQPAMQPVLADWARRGIAQVQDPTSADVVNHMRLQPGQIVLDRCCGMGTKTLQMRQSVSDSGLIVAMDTAGERCAALSEILAARGIANVRVRTAGMLAQLPPDDPAEYDRILVDAPCSNSGVLARRPEARYSQSSRHLRSLAQIQDRLLDDCAPRLAPGGLLLYSTCSIWPQENEERVAAFLSHHPQLSLIEQRTTLPCCADDPTRYRDGGYTAVVERPGGAASAAESA